jgi:hypothetical protein
MAGPIKRLQSTRGVEVAAQIASPTCTVRERDRVDVVLLRLEGVNGLSETAALRQKRSLAHGAFTSAAKPA